MPSYDAIIDAGFDAFRNDATGALRASLCSAAPANYAGISGVQLGISAALTPSTQYNAPADGDVSGRKIETASDVSIPVTTGGTATHIAFHDNTDTLWAVADLASGEVVSNSETWKIPVGFRIEIQDPA